MSLGTWEGETKRRAANAVFCPALWPRVGPSRIVELDGEVGF